MNPFAALFIVLGILFLVVAFNGKQDNLIAAVTGRPYGGSDLK